MRVHFKNLGQAELFLNTCKDSLADHLRLRGDARLPSQRVRNAFCQGFGYSSYDELKRCLSTGSREVKPITSEIEFLRTFVKGFSLAFEVAAECGASTSEVDKFMAPLLAQGAVDLLKREGGAGELFTPTSGERAEEYLDHGWGIISNGDPREPVPQRLLAPAEEQFRLAIAADPDLADAYNGLALIEFSRGNFEAVRHLSELALEKALKDLGTDAPTAYVWYGESKTRPYMRARHNLGLSLMRLGDVRGAVREFKEMLRRNPNDNQGVRFLIGPLYHKIGDLRHAIPAYRRAAAKGDNSGDPHNEINYALALYESENVEESVLRLRYGMLVNLHIPQVLLGLPVRRLDIWYGSNHYDPEYAVEYADQYGYLWEGKKGALALLRGVYFHATVQAEMNEYVQLCKQLDKTDDINKRFPIAHKLSRIKSLGRLKENNKLIVEGVLAQFRQ